MLNKSEYEMYKVTKNITGAEILNKLRKIHEI